VSRKAGPSSCVFNSHETTITLRINTITAINIVEAGASDF
jgi:hypothetical protein